MVGPNGIFKAAPNPNAAKLFQNYCFTPDAQQIIIEIGGLRSLHAQAKDKPGRKPLADIKLMKEDAAGRRKAERRTQGALSEAVSCLIRHCEERSDEAIQRLQRKTGLLHFARNDEEGDSRCERF